MMPPRQARRMALRDEVRRRSLPRTRVNKGPGLLRVPRSFMEDSWPHPKIRPAGFSLHCGIATAGHAGREES
ncbi:MAG: hypothetical protein AVDCRST_MAG01-01-3851 [uncultured Rubrobacteraceae bacterium]|uniref:Uncharacterized protein n=1 Tax=uncultured Rubrobacteraceae bacterium TaxID=349277 RepID=A0A6J4QQC7_9ACTN|nr:MAG: hypothetical protein AVDCRST_MAG01-01-3851 [uncultured Rubrobacteraceae bacterium]